MAIYYPPSPWEYSSSDDYYAACDAYAAERLRSARESGLDVLIYRDCKEDDDEDEEKDC